jgi:hypothetical protein
MLVPHLREARVALPCVGDDHLRGRIDHRLHESSTGLRGLPLPSSRSGFVTRCLTSTAPITAIWSWTPFPLPRVRPPTQVSSTATCVLMPIRPLVTAIDERSLWRIWNAVS